MAFQRIFINNVNHLFEGYFAETLLIPPAPHSPARASILECEDEARAEDTTGHEGDGDAVPVSNEEKVADMSSSGQNLGAVSPKEQERERVAANDDKEEVEPSQQKQQVEEVEVEVPQPKRQQYHVSGTLSNRGNFSIDHMSDRIQIVASDDHRALKQALLTADVIVYRLFRESDLEQVNYALNMIESSPAAGPQTFILVSSVVTWSSTPRATVNRAHYDDGSGGGEGNERSASATGSEVNEASVTNEGGEKENCSYAPLHEDSYKERQAKPRYQPFLDVEKRVMKMNSDLLHTFVVCSGILYGEGEEYLHQFFKMAWSFDCEALPCFLGGNNYLPLVHVHDLASIVRYVMEHSANSSERPTTVELNRRYVLAVDDDRITLKQLLLSISKTYGGSGDHLGPELRSVSGSEMLLYDYTNYLTLDMEFETTVAKGWGIAFEYASGISDHVRQVRDQYERRRNVSPLKVAYSTDLFSLKTMRMIAERFSDDVCTQFRKRCTGEDLLLEIQQQQLLQQQQAMATGARKKKPPASSARGQGSASPQVSIQELQQQLQQQLQPESLFSSLCTLIQGAPLSTGLQSPIPIDRAKVLVAQFIGMNAQDEQQQQQGSFIEEGELSKRQQNEPPESQRQKEVIQVSTQEEESEKPALKPSQQEQEQQRINEIIREENIVLKERSKPLQQYLMSSVVPVVMRGLIDVSLVRPNDPITHLAQYLRSHNPMNEGMEQLDDSGANM